MDALSGLNEPQRLAVTAEPGPVLVLAGPGSGKTRVLTQRIAYLIQIERVAPWHILAVTFTNKAAREMRHRIEALLGNPPRGLTMGTFHGVCAGILRREADHLPYYTNEFVIFDTDDQRQVTRQALLDLNLDDKRFSPARMHGHISAAKNEFITPEQYAATTYIAEITRRVYARYQELLRANNAMDFDDLLMNALILFDDNPDVLARYQARYQHILVDEFQDTNTTQYGLLQRLAAAHHNVFAVGDADQSIYRWRGADVRNINRFRQHYPDARLVLLEQNYRSTQIILDAAKAVIRRNRDRIDKELFTERRGGERISVREAYDDREEASIVVDTIAELVREGYEPGDMAVMYRTNAQSRALEEAFILRGLPYRLVGATRFYGRREIKDVVAYLRLVHNPADGISFSRVVNTPTRGIGRKTLEQLEGWAARLGIQPGEALLRLTGDPDVQHPFTGRAFNAVAGLGEMLKEWVRLSQAVPVGDLVDQILEDVDYHDYITDGSQEGEERWANVVELRNVARESDDTSLSEFLEQVALVSDVDNLEETANAPTLLTLHAAKGLEFPVVFITGLEEGILPHARSFEDPEGMDEERRLFYVGLTRAMDRLYLLYAFRRVSFGVAEVSTPSSFLHDIPGELVMGGRAGKPPPRRESRAEWRGNRAPVTPGGSTRGRATGRRGGRGSGASSPQIPETSPEAAPPPDLPSFRTGQRVRHGAFGEGYVVETKVTGNDVEVVVAFSDAGIKRLAASMARLEVIG